MLIVKWSTLKSTLFWRVVIDDCGAVWVRREIRDGLQLVQLDAYIF